MRRGRQRRFNFSVGNAPLALLLLSLIGTIGVMPSAHAQATGQPNIILILTDDMRADDLVGMPYTQQALLAAGTSFSNAFVTTPICCPSRVSILRGQYTHNHGIWANKPLFRGEPSSFPKFYADGEEGSTIATWLHAAGYRTALIGKYLNNYPDTALPGYVPPGWDAWAVHFRGRYYGFGLVENGEIKRYPAKDGAYSTDVYAEKAIEFVRDAANDGQPFFLYLAPHAPHFDYTPATRHADAFPGATAPRGPGFNESDISDKPPRIRDLTLLSGEKIREIDVHYRERLQTLLAVDEMIAGLDRVLAETGALANTYVVFTSDNGLFLGEHRLALGKGAPYDEAIRVPLVVRGPGVPAGRVDDHLVLNADLAPTFAALGGTKPADFVDGRSLVPLLHGGETDSWRKMVLVEFAGAASSAAEEDSSDEASEAPEDDAGPVPGFRLLVTRDLRYIEYDDGAIELYDVVNDPAEIDNLAAAASAFELQRLSGALSSLATCAAATCRAAENASID